MAIYMWREANFATQGPAPDYFHVPLSSEWNNVKSIWTTLGGGSSDGTGFGAALKLPYGGCRQGSGDTTGQNTQGHYWTSSSSSAGDDYASILYFYSSNIGDSAANVKTTGGSIRAFKNSTVVPTSSWIKLYGTSIEAGGIFWSSSLGLISLSSNGTTWITIADKNLGATTVWNSGDTLSEANCGKYYQWGNNYGFAWTGTLTDTSTTQVDASSYGPGNYYNSSTYIKRYGSWDGSNNANLRGGEDGNVPV